jgi:pSer/pThr/pTyr-binding forkhead associated (FHA) protein
MSKKILVVSLDGQESPIPLLKERTILGRGKDCDVVIDDSAVSRRHAAIIFKFENVYIENISPTGHIHKGERPVEYAELKENEEVNIGPFSIFWRKENLEDSIAEAGSAAMETPSEDPAPEQAEDFPLVASSDAESGENNEGVGDQAPALLGDSGAVDGADATQIVDMKALPRLKVIRGEEDGREIKLDSGTMWVVGRSRKSHICIDNAKLSRQHFKIIRIKDRFRIQDLGSSGGTRLNGVTVVDSPLNPFDTIQAGPVELQFLLVESAYQHVDASDLAPHQGALRAPDKSENTAAGQPTIVNAPVPWNPNQDAFGSGTPGLTNEEFVLPRSPQGDHEFGSENGRGENTNSNGEVPKGLVARVVFRIKGSPTGEKFFAWYGSLPPGRQKAYKLGSVGLSVLLLFMLVPTEKPDIPRGVASVDTEALEGADSTLAQSNAAVSSDISPTFYSLSLDVQERVRKRYSDAERAQAKKNWKEVIEATNDVLAQVDRYKKAKDMLLQAQSMYNEEEVAKLSGSIKDVEDAANANKQSVQTLLQTGIQALIESRWSDADESCSKVIALEPNNREALDCITAAKNKNYKAKYDGPMEPVKEDPDVAAKQAAMEELEALKAQYRIASDKVRNNEFRSAIPELLSLESELSNRIYDYEGGQRAPASIRDELKLESKALLSYVQEAYDTALSQLRIEYQTQLADAEQFINNRQFVQAREIYDSIVQREPYFDEVKTARGKLYLKIVAEARTLYQGALVYESVGDLRNAVSGYQKAKELLTNVRDLQAMEYHKKASRKLALLQR